MATLSWESADKISKQIIELTGMKPVKLTKSQSWDIVLGIKLPDTIKDDDTSLGRIAACIKTRLMPIVELEGLDLDNITFD